MTQDEINKIYAFEDLVELATQADCLYIERYDIWQLDRTTLKAFAKLVAAKEREACANFVVNEYVRQFEKPWREDLADAIRARSISIGEA